MCMYVIHHLYAWRLWNSEDNIRSSETGVMDGCEPLGRCWESDLGPVQEQLVLNCLSSHLSSPMVYAHP